MNDPNPLVTGPTKWRADHCVTHHCACDCREWEHANDIERLEARADRAEELLSALSKRCRMAIRDSEWEVDPDTTITDLLLADEFLAEREG